MRTVFVSQHGNIFNFFEVPISSAIEYVFQTGRNREPFHTARVPFPVHSVHMEALARSWICARLPAGWKAVFE